jgi:hypothetical protein
MPNSFTPIGRVLHRPFSANRLPAILKTRQLDILAVAPRFVRVMRQGGNGRQCETPWGLSFMDLVSGETGARLVIAVASVGLALAVFAGILWVVRNRPIAPLLSRATRDRQKRIVVVESAMVDTRRRVVLIRRDNVEHLVLIGGPADLVVESGIEYAGAAYAAPSQYQEAPQPEAATRRLETRDQASANAATRQPRQRRVAETAMPAEENGYTYGPEAALSARDFSPEPTNAPDPRKQAPGRAASPATAASAISDESAESIIAMLRARVFGDESEAETAQQPAAPAPRYEEPPRTPPAPAGSAFSRVLDGNPQPGDLPPDLTPTVKPSIPTWSPAMGRLNPVPQKRKVTEESRESQRRDQLLELEMTRILEEMQMRRSQ